MLNFRRSRYMTSAPTLAECPADEGLEVAFAGRSNAGKSSAINRLTENSKLARTSKTPGRTQLLNFFSITEQQRLVDLPGYGFAKVPLAVKQRWQRHLDDYLRRRQSLQGLVLVMDVRHPLQAFDQMFVQWAIECEMPLHILLTKADKLKNGPAHTTLLNLRKQLAEHQTLITAQLFSATKGKGLQELQQRLSDWLYLPEEALPAATTDIKKPGTD